MIGIAIQDYIGVGDKVQFSSLPENYFLATKQKLVDVSKCWIFDHNPYVLRGETPTKTIQLWNFGPTQYQWPKPRAGVYQTNAEIWAQVLGVKPKLARPRLYRFEDYPFEKREKILLQICGRSHGTLPKHIIDHVVRKYKPTGQLFQIGHMTDPDVGIPKIPTGSLWDLAAVISQARMVIGPDSGPSWIAACYPDVVVKKVRVRHPHGWKSLEEWVPLEIENFHSHWDDRAFGVYNATEEDQGFTLSYKKL